MIFPHSIPLCPINLIKEKLINLIEWTFKREGSPYIACNERQTFYTSEDTKRYKLWSCQNVCEALIYLLDNIYIRFGIKLYRQIVGIPMGTQDQDQDSLLVKRRNDNHSPGPVIRELVPSSHQRSELSNTILCIFSG